MRFFLALLFFFAPPLFASSKYGLIQVPAADVRSASGTLPSSYELYDPLEETQVLYGERVEIKDASGDWLQIHALEQIEFSHTNAWEGYPGWVRKDSVYRTNKSIEPKFIVKVKTGGVYPRPYYKRPMLFLSLGTKLIATGAQKNDFWGIKTVQGKSAWVPKSDVRLLTPPLPEEYSRTMVLENASQLLGDPYFWGGRSAASVDCSGLTNLAYRVAGIDIPRDSYEQYLKAKKIKKEDLKPADLIFSAAKDKPEKVSHVAIFVDSGTILEAPQTGLTVRKISFMQKYGAPFEQIKEGEPVGDRVLYFGTYFDR